IRPRLMFFPAWKTNLEGPNCAFIRIAGGIPIPTQNLRSMVAFKKAMEEVFSSKTWMHFYPEGSMWYFYPDIRPFKKAVFQYAVQYNRPVLPITMSFRRRKGITRLFTKTPCVNLHVGEPLTANPDLNKREAAEDLRARTYHIMQGMNGIFPGDPTYNTDQNIDHYQKTM
ncbi:MAG: 1-acyl-sn-glycerol-3-phosphate acyltransferase, partial [Clostridia bacterium]|nr:1-acyl-sn-glycerol-3-phosphate acyltransferase [Clostridia bacterium]